MLYETLPEKKKYIMEVLLMTTLVLGLLERINENANKSVLRTVELFHDRTNKNTTKFFDVEKHFGILICKCTTRR